MQLPENCTYLIESLQRFLKEKNYREAEKTVIAIVEEVIHFEQNLDSHVLLLPLVIRVYELFNRISSDVEHSPKPYLQSDPQNCVIGRCSKLSELDDILYETMQFLMEKSTKKDVEELITYYKRDDEE